MKLIFYSRVTDYKQPNKHTAWCSVIRTAPGRNQGLGKGSAGWDSLCRGSTAILYRVVRKSLRRWQLNTALRFMHWATQISAIWSLSIWPVGTACTKAPNWGVLGMLTIRQENQCGKKDWQETNQNEGKHRLTHSGVHFCFLLWERWEATRGFWAEDRHGITWAARFRIKQGQSGRLRNLE